MSHPSLSLEGWSTKAKETASPHEVRLTPLDTNPVFKCLRLWNVDSKLCGINEAAVKEIFIAKSTKYILTWNLFFYQGVNQKKKVTTDFVKPRKFWHLWGGWDKAQKPTKYGKLESLP